MKFKTKKYVMLRPRKEHITSVSTKSLHISKLQLKKKILFLLKKKKKWQLQWLINPFFYIHRRRKIPRRLIFRIKQKKYRRYLRKKIALSEKKLDKLRKRIQKRKQRAKKKKKKQRTNWRLKRLKFKRKKRKRVIFARFMSRRHKYLRYHKGRNPTCFTKKNKALSFGLIGFRILKSSKLKASAIYNAFFTFRKALKKKRKRVRFKLWNYARADVPVSQKPRLIRMGKGKGEVKFWIYRAAYGKMLFEMNFNKKKRITRGFKMFKKILNRPIVMLTKFPGRWNQIFTLKKMW